MTLHMTPRMTGVAIVGSSGPHAFLYDRGNLTSEIL